MPERIVIALSGGVDSSVSALLLLEAGYEVEALFMKNWNEPTGSGQCRWEDDVADALAVSEKLGIPLNTVDLSATYWDEVFRHFLTEYQLGRTPNPDILCNREIKFKAFMEHVHARGASHIATGHYARIERDQTGYRMLKGCDPNKDQTYFLYTLGQEQLASALFPVGALPKAEVRRIAASAGLVTHDKRDSTGICFIGEEHFRSFMGRYLPAQPGAIVTEHGEQIGTHQGVFYYTLGQRQGLGIGGVRNAPEEPWYVLDKRVTDNVLVVGQGHDHPALLSCGLRADTLSWIAGHAPGQRFDCTARIRHRQHVQACHVSLSDDDDVCTVMFESQQRAVAPGQSVVFYQGDICLGGGVIATRISNA
ncbi:MAG: tRNA 2-thiouridine(34) synthase MnmA [Gammaproteobacteria bacterium]|nr:tRNA 2-thiouridine(34) synthase MnmA [Gammaproteobacteria bacterium]